MKLLLIEGNTSYAAQRRLYERLKEQDASDVNHVLLVPDRYTVGVERDLVTYCFPEGFANADVNSFTRFAVKTVGKRIDECLTKEGTVVLLRKVLKRTDTKYYKKLFGYGFAKELFAAIASLRSAGVTVDDVLREADLTPGVLGDKLHDIALVEKGYEEEIAGRFTDTVTRIDALEEYLKSADLSLTHFYVLGFNIYSGQQLRILRTLAKNAASLTVTAVALRGCEPCPGGQAERLLDDCAAEGVPTEREEVFERVKEDVEYLRIGMFNPRAKKRPVDCSVTLFREESPYEEIAATAREIRYLVRKEGYRYKDFAVVVNDERYLPILRETFDRCAVPNFIDEGYPVCDGLAARYVFGLLEAAEYVREGAVYKLARHPYFGLKTEDAEAFVRYCKQFGVRYRRFAEPFFVGDFEQAESVRAVIDAVVSSVPKEGTAAEYAAFFTSLLTAPLAESEEKKFASSTDERLRAAADREPVLRFLAEFAALAGEEKFGCFDYASTLRSALSDMKTVLAPDVYDAVFVGGTEESRFDGAKVGFFLGCTDESFPKKSGDGLIFSAYDNEALRHRDMKVFPSPVERNALERFLIRDVMSRFSDRMYFGCAETDLDGSEQVPGDGMNEIAYLSGKRTVRLAESRDLDEKERLLYRLASEKNALYEYLTGDLGPAKDSVRAYLERKGLLAERADQEDYVPVFERDEEGRAKTSVSRLETYFTCPFRYFMRYGVGVQPEEDSTLKVNVVGTAVHNILEDFFKQNAAKIDQKEDFSAEIEQAIRKEFVKSDYDIYREDVLASYLINELKKECRYSLPVLIDNMRHSKFRPMGYEVAFGYRKDDDLILLKTNNETFKVVGKVDRVDEYDHKVVIVDYKTGSVEPTLSDVYYGKKIQLYVYLKHFMDAGYEPAGVFYLPIGGTNVSKGRSYAMTGQMVRDFGIYRALDDRVDRVEGTRFKSQAMDIGAQKVQGEWKIYSGSKNALEKDAFYAVVEYVQKLCQGALTEILDGYAEKKPFDEKDCEWCDYRRLCGKVPARSVSGTVSAETFSMKDGDQRGTEEDV
ncbi:MAG: PD-(D/E)XK nuclease family protein [Clostridia bacterium]|nr:PD-(D/E)XK nuclease family protein [Clostridia bacterium]